MREELPSLGSTVGPWLILKRLDSGSFGVVYRAHRAGHPDSPPVVVKMARRPRDPRFEREAELLRLGIPGAPRFEDEGLWTAPSGEHIRVEPQGRAVLVDWGSGWFEGARPLTDTTAPPGTTAYRPPEQRVFSYRFRKDLDARWQAKPTDDLYSLGVAFYRCVTGLYLKPLSEGGEVASSREVVRPSVYVTVNLELEALILRLLSNKREARGTAAQLAREAMALAEQAGDGVDRPIVPAEGAESTDSGESSSDGLDDEEVLSDTDDPTEPSNSTDSTRVRRRRRRQAVVPEWAAPALAALAGGFLVALVTIVFNLLSRTSEPAPRLEEPPRHVAQFAPDAGVGEESLSSLHEIPRAVMQLASAISEPMPKTPFPGQEKPPCDPDGEIAALGACWVVMKKGNRSRVGNWFEGEAGRERADMIGRVWSVQPTE